LNTAGESRRRFVPCDLIDTHD